MSSPLERDPREAPVMDNIFAFLGRTPRIRDQYQRFLDVGVSLPLVSGVDLELPEPMRTLRIVDAMKGFRGVTWGHIEKFSTALGEEGRTVPFPSVPARESNPDLEKERRMRLQESLIRPFLCSSSEREHELGLLGMKGNFVASLSFTGAPHLIAGVVAHRAIRYGVGDILQRNLDERSAQQRKERPS